MTRPPRPLPVRPRPGDIWFAQVEPARQGIFPYYQHECGYIEAFAADELDGIKGGCDACESGSADPNDWQPVWRMVRETPVHTNRPPCE